MSEPSQVMTAEERATVTLREVRIALVCYGGVSLAVYMHGVTKELFKLVRAARAFEAAYEADPELADPVALDEVAAHLPGRPQAQGPDRPDTERAYFDALVALARAGTPLTVNIDIVTGTSAGGINGVCLAHALAQGRSLEPFRDVWLDEGDIAKLVRRDGVHDEAHDGAHDGATDVHEPRERRLGAAGRLLHGVGAALDRARLLGDPRSWTPLNGDLMSRLVRDALVAMGPAQGSLLRPDTTLDLRVTTTDVHGFQSDIPTGAGGLAHTDLSYRQLFRFRHEPGSAGQASDFTDDDVDALAFAARATSSFPGAFPSIGLGSYLKAVGRSGAAGSDGEEHRARILQKFVYGDAFTSGLATAWYMDGGVLDNGPFDHALDAIGGMRATGPTSRRLVYIEPDPSAPVVDRDGPRPTTLGVVKAARSTIPRRQVFVEALRRLAVTNAAVAEVGTLVEKLEERVDDVLVDLDLPAEPSYQDTLDTAPAVRERARKESGLAYATYCRLRAESLANEVGPALARALGYTAESSRAAFVTAVLSASVRRQGSWNAEEPEALEALLGSVDVAFRRRRANLVLREVNAMYAEGPEEAVRARLGAAKKATWTLLLDLRAQGEAMVAAAAVAAVGLLDARSLSEATALASADAFAETHAEAISAIFGAYQGAATLAGSSRALWEVLAASPPGVDPGVSARLRSRYLLFPVWDALLFPLIELPRLSSFNPVRVQAFTPLAATTLEPRPEARVQKLKGRSIQHFGGFFRQAWRENDYLWGRLDGVELICRLLADEAREPDGHVGRDGDGPDLDAELRTGLWAVLDAETPHLPTCHALVDRLRTQVGSVSLADAP